MLGIAVANIMKVTNKVAICSYVSKMVLTATMVEFELEVVHSTPNIIMVTRTFAMAAKPSQSKVAIQPLELYSLFSCGPAYYNDNA